MKNLIKIITLLYFCTLTASANVIVSSNNLISEPKKTILTVAITNKGYFPYNYIENGERKGLTIDVINYFEANSNYDFEFIILPWPRALYLVEQGKIDLIMTLFKNDEREETYHFIEPSYANEANQLFALVDTNIEYSGELPQLIPYSVGTIREYSYGQSFDQANYLTKLPALTEEVLLKLLLAERIDVAISNPLTFKGLISEGNLEKKIKALKPYVDITPVYLALTKARDNSDQIAKDLGELTMKLKASSYYQTLLNKYQVNFN